jgi:hypothetical protein
MNAAGRRLAQDRVNIVGQRVGYELKRLAQANLFPVAGDDLAERRPIHSFQHFASPTMAAADADLFAFKRFTLTKVKVDTGGTR